jgi:hypothetical protein
MASAFPQIIPGSQDFPSYAPREYDEQQRESIQKTLFNTQQEIKEIKLATHRAVHQIDSVVYAQMQETLNTLIENEKKCKEDLRKLEDDGLAQRRRIKEENLQKMNQIAKNQKEYMDGLDKTKEIEQEEFTWKHNKLITQATAEEKKIEEDEAKSIMLAEQLQQQFDNELIMEHQEKVIEIKTKEDEMKFVYEKTLVEETQNMEQFLAEQKRQLQAVQEEERRKQIRIQQEAEEARRKIKSKKGKDWWSFPFFSKPNPQNQPRSPEPNQGTSTTSGSLTRPNFYDMGELD